MEKQDSADTMDMLKGSSVTETDSNNSSFYPFEISDWVLHKVPKDNKLINRDGYLEKSHLAEECYGYRNQNLNLNENDINDDGYGDTLKDVNSEDGGSFNNRRNYQFDTISKFPQQHFKQRADDSSMSQNVYAANQSEDKRNKPPPFMNENSHKSSEYSLGSNSKTNNANNPFTDQSAREESSLIQQHPFTHILQGSGNQSHISNPVLLDQRKSSTVTSQRHHQDRSAIEGADSFPASTNIATLTTDENINIQEKITYRMSVEGASRTSSTTDGKSTTSLQQQQHHQQQQQPPFDHWYKNSLQTNDGGCWQQSSPSSFDGERGELLNTAHNTSSDPNSVTSEGLSNRFKDIPSSKEPIPQKSNYAIDPTSNYRTVNNEFVDNKFRRETNIVNSNSPSGSADSKLFSSQNQYYDQQNQLGMSAINNSSYERNHLAIVDNLIFPPPPPPSAANSTYERNQPPRGPSSLHEVGYNDGTSKSAFHKATANSQRTHPGGKQAVPTLDENQFCVVDNSRVPISRVDSRLNFEKIPQFSNERAVVPGAQRSNSNEINNIYVSSSTPISDERSRQSVSPDNRTRKLSKQFSMDQQPYSSNESPPIELQRIVLGETGSNSPPLTSRKQDIKEPSQLSTVHSDETVKHSVSSAKEKESYPPQRGERGHHNRREYNSKRRRHRRMDSDEEDYDVADRRYDSPDRSSHSHRPKESSRYAIGSRKPEPSRRDCENSFTQSQDESYYDEDDYEDDYDSGHYKYYSRRPPKDNRHRHYNYDSFYRDERRNYRDRRRDMYNPRIEEDSYYNERPSRPLSRSDSDYRRDTQEYFYSTLPRYYDRPANYAVQYNNHGTSYRQFDSPIEKLLHFRERDPKGYAAWYKWYLSTRKRTEAFSTSSNTAAATIPAAATSLTAMNSYHSNERRGSGHLSGQSSGNEEVLSRSKDKLLDSYPDESAKSDIASIQEQRDSPLKFNVPHIKGVFNGLGQLIVINPPHAQNGEPNIVDIYQFTAPESETEVKELLNLPGPFIIGETHVNTVSDYLKYKANSAVSKNSEKLLYLLVYLIIKLRGRVDGIAISELLMENYEQFSYNTEVRSSSNDLSISLRNEIHGTNDTDNSKFMQQYVQLLIQGNKINALELAINNKQWGHAFSLAYKMDMKYFSSVLTLFDNSVSNNSPLTTLYQLLSGRLPQSIEHFAREKYNDWRPHLAMILSNTTGNMDLARHAVETLGNSLANQNDIHAAHFCYLTMELNFGSECLSKLKYNLLSLTNSQINRLTCVKLIPAIMLTQAYEFAVQLQHKQFVIPSLMIYKFLLVQTLVTYNRYNAAYQYLEQIGTAMSQNSTLYSHELAQHIINLTERIKYHVTDHATIVKDSLQSDQWLSALQSLFVASMKINDSGPFNKDGSLPSQQISTLNQLPPSDQLKMDNHHLPQFYQPNLYSVSSQSYPPDTYKQNVSEQASHYSQSSEMQYGQEPSCTISDINSNPVYPNQIRNPNTVHNFTDNNSGGNFTNYNTSTENSSPTENSANTLSSDSTDPNYYAPWNQQYAQSVSISTKFNYDYFENADLEDHRISSDNTAAASLSNTENYSNENRESSTASNKSNGSGKDKKLELAGNNSGGGWLDGFLWKWSLRSTNQMKLPDDKKKTIKWSDEKNRWINVGDDGDEDTGDNFKPPPKASELNSFVSDTMNRLPSNSTSGLTAVANSDPAKTIPTGDASSSFNMYKMSKGRGMKANYVNVLSQNVTPSNSQLPAPSLNAFSNPPMPNTKMFAPSLPATSNEVKKDNFSGPPSIGDSTQGAVNHQGPIFYNPSQYKS